MTKEEALAKMDSNKGLRFGRQLTYIVGAALVVVIVNNPFITDLIVDVWKSANQFWLETTLISFGVMVLACVYTLSYKLNQ